MDTALKVNIVVQMCFVNLTLKVETWEVVIKYIYLYCSKYIYIHVYGMRAVEESPPTF